MISGILLAAGLSKRFGSQKLLVSIQSGQTLFEHALRMHLEADLLPLVAVVSERLLESLLKKWEGKSAFRIDRETSRPWFNLETPWGKVRLIVNKSPEEGMADSLKLGLGILSDPERQDGILVSLADMPKVTPGMIRNLIDIYQKERGKIVVPTFQGKIGHPVIIHEPSYREEILKISGDKGLRDIIKANIRDVVYIPWADDSVTADVDTIPDMGKILQGG